MKDRKLQPWELLERREVFAAPPYLTISTLRLRLPGGRIVDPYYQVRLAESVVIFAQTRSGRVVMERMYKQGLGRVTLVLPAGMLEQGEDPLDAAQRELLEETGYASGDWARLGSFAPNGNLGCGLVHIFMARNARRTAKPDPGDLEEMETVLVEPPRLAAAIVSGETGLLSTVAAFALATNPALATLRCPNATRAAAKRKR